MHSLFIYCVIYPVEFAGFVLAFCLWGLHVMAQIWWGAVKDTMAMVTEKERQS